MSLFREDIIENAASERELCLMDPYYFVSKYVMIKPNVSQQEAFDTLSDACERMNITPEEYNEIIAKYTKGVW